MTGPTFKIAAQNPTQTLPWTGVPPLSIQQLWFSIQRVEWATLAIIPAGPETSALDFGRPLYEVGKLAMGERLRLLDARTVKLSGVAPLIVDMVTPPAGPRSTNVQWSERAMVLVESVLVQPAAVPVALAADAALLCVELGKTSMASARETLDIVGRQRFIGCVTLGR